MRKTAVWYGISKLLQALGLMLVAPLVLAVWDYRSLAVGDIIDSPEIIGLVFSVGLCLMVGTLLSRLFRHGKDLQGVKEGF
ncbi:MAG: hypothetical protein D6800_11270, partial [Candidatus Zixiibacteriota bacterium]